MTLTSAPYFEDIARGPEGGRAFWVQAADNHRLRVGHWSARGNARGTVLLFPGRTEYVEKYGPVAGDLTTAGYDVLTIDWRGQGLADRMLDDARVGHVHTFADYQQDVQAMLALAGALDLPSPLHLIGHSMGGCIGLRALHLGLPVASALFTGPMWGIRIASPVRPAAWAVGWTSKVFGLSHFYAPSTSAESYVVSTPFADNMLTTDREMFDFMRDQVLAHPELQLGGPSLHWLYEALVETRELANLPAPDVPCLTFVGSNERIVSVPRVHARMASWPKGSIKVIENGEHEVLMEPPEKRSVILKDAFALFEKAGRATGVPHAGTRNAAAAS